MLSRKEKGRAFVAIAVGVGIWQSVEEWTRLLSSFLQWELQPSPVDMWRLGILNTVGNVFNLIGTIVVAQILDSAGVKAAGLIVTVVSGIYHLIIASTYQYVYYLGAQSLRTFSHFLQIADVYSVSISDDTEHHGSKTRAVLRLSIPLGVAMALGPALAGYTTIYTNDMRMSIAMAGMFLVILLLPTLLFALPELPTQRRKGRMLAMPSLHEYRELLRSKSTRWILLFKFLIDTPYQSFDQLSRQYLILHMIKAPADLSWLFMLMGLSTLFTSLFLIRILQRYLSPKRLLQLSLLILIATYILLSLSMEMVMVIMPIQVVGISIAYSELTGQLLGSVDKELIGKTAGLSQIVHLLAATVTPLLSGYLMQAAAFGLLCTLSAAMTVVVLILVQLKGHFLDLNRALPHMSPS